LAPSKGKVLIVPVGVSEIVPKQHTACKECLGWIVPRGPDEQVPREVAVWTSIHDAVHRRGHRDLPAVGRKDARYRWIHPGQLVHELAGALNERLLGHADRRRRLIATRHD